MWPENAVLINWVFGLILLPVSYGIVSLCYRRGDGAVVGSLMFNFVYIAISLVLWGLLTLLRIIIDNWVIVIISASGVVMLMAAIVGIVLVKKRKATKAKQQKTNEE